jgi:hypothetical protein
MPRPMPKYKQRYELNGHWFRGAIHLHTTASDGRFTTDELIDVYRRMKYDFICITEHHRHAEKTAHDAMLLLNGMEITFGLGYGRWMHVVAVEPGDFQLAKERQGGLRSVCRKLQRNGAMLIVAHPHWSALTTHDVEIFDFDGVEVYNYGCHKDTGKQTGVIHWDYLLSQGEDTLGFAVDDTHGSQRLHDWGGGWIVINAPRLDKPSVMAALRRGNFYASNGPSIRGFKIKRDSVEVETSPVVSARLIGFNGFAVTRWADDGKRRRKWELPMPAAADIARKWRFVRLEVEDERGKMAWTNNLLTERQ